jgi:signal peptidase I
MDINFPLILTLLTLGSGAIWLADSLIWAPRRKRHVEARQVSVPVHDSAGGESSGTPEAPWLVEMSRSFFPVLAIVLILRSFLVEPFQIPSGSMLPTLEVGDFILVNKFAYGLRLPVLGTKIVPIGEPQRGDIMVFHYPKDGKTNYIKRVIGLPGDKISYHNKTLYINGKQIPEVLLADIPPARQVYEEDLGTLKHKIWDLRNVDYPGSEGDWVVPQGNYFVMGDNRDNSNDSRYWGFVPEKMVVGRAFAIWMQWKSLVSLPSFSRVGGIENGSK